MYNIFESPGYLTLLTPFETCNPARTSQSLKKASRLTKTNGPRIWQTENDRQQTFDEWQDDNQAQAVPPTNFDSGGQDEVEFEDPEQFPDYEETVTQHDGYERPNLLNTGPCDIPEKLGFLAHG